ncbi:MAG: hypothetical protein ACRES5_04215 [Pseudomonas sp.]
MPVSSRVVSGIDVVAGFHGVEIDLGLALIQAGKRRLQQLGQNAIEQGREGWQFDQFVEHGLLVQALVLRDARGLFLIYVALESLIGHMDIVTGRQGFALGQRHERQQIVVFAGIVQILPKLFRQGRSAVVLLYAAVGGIEHYPVGFRGRAQHETAGQGDRFLIGDAQPNAFDEHWRILLTAQCPGG